LAIWVSSQVNSHPRNGWLWPSREAGKPRGHTGATVHVKKNLLQAAENHAGFSLKNALLIVFNGHLSALNLNVKQNRSGCEKNCKLSIPAIGQAMLTVSITGPGYFLNFPLRQRQRCAIFTFVF